MERRKPDCLGGLHGTDHSAAAHVSHQFFPYQLGGWGTAAECPGWSERDDDAAALSIRLDQVARDAGYPFDGWQRKMPPGIRLECHPLVPAALQQLFIPSYAEFTASLNLGVAEDLMKPQIPVVVTAGMERGAWRIAADDGLIVEGTVSNG